MKRSLSDSSKTGAKTASISKKLKPGNVSRKSSAGIYLRHDNMIFLVQPTGSSGYGIPKGLIELDETAEEAARREFHEETGIDVSSIPLEYLKGSADIKGGKIIYAFMGTGNGTEKYISSNIITDGFRAGKPENSGGGYFTIEEASRVVHKNQLKLLELYKRTISAAMDV